MLEVTNSNENISSQLVHLVESRLIPQLDEFIESYGQRVSEKVIGEKVSFNCSCNCFREDRFLLWASMRWNREYRVKHYMKIDALAANDITISVPEPGPIVYIILDLDLDKFLDMMRVYGKVIHEGGSYFGKVEIETNELYHLNYNMYFDDSESIEEQLTVFLSMAIEFLEYHFGTIVKSLHEEFGSVEEYL